MSVQGFSALKSFLSNPGSYLEGLTHTPLSLKERIKLLSREFFESQGQQIEIPSDFVTLAEKFSFEQKELVNPLLLQIFISQFGPQNGQLNFFVENVDELAAIRQAFNLLPREAFKNVQTTKGVVTLFSGHLGRDGIDRILRLLRLIPADARVGVIDLAIPLISKTENGKEREAILKAIKTIPLHHRAKLIELAIAFIEGTEDSNGVADVLRTLNRTLVSERKGLVDMTIPLVIGMPNTNQRAEILKAVRGIRADEREEVIRLALPLFIGVSDPQKGAILSAIGEIQWDERALAVEIASPLLRDIQDDKLRLEILKAIKDIQAAERGEVIRLALPLFVEVSDHQKVAILSAIDKIRWDERALVVELASPLMRGIQDGKLRLEILEAINGIRADQREEVIRIALPLFVGLSDHRKVAILSAICKIQSDRRSTIELAEGGLLRAVDDMPVAEIASLLNLAVPFITGIHDGEEISDIFKAIGYIPADERMGVIDLATHLIISLPDTRERAVVMRAIHRIPASERAHVIGLAAPYINNCEDGPQCAAILDAFFYAGDNGEVTAQQLIPLISGIKTRSDRSSIIEIIRSIPADDRASVIEHATPLMGGIADDSKRIGILQGIGRLSRAERSEIVGLATPLIHIEVQNRNKKRIWDSQIGDVFEVIRSIPRDEGEEIIALATPFISYIGYVNVAGILKAIGSIPAAERAFVIERATSLMREFPGDFQLVHFLRGIGRVSRGEREEIIALAAPLICYIEDGKVAPILKAIAPIPAGEKRGFMNLATSLIGRTEYTVNGYTLAAILDLIKEIPVHELISSIDLARRLMHSYHNFQIDKTFDLIKRISADEREGFFELVNPFICNVPCGLDATNAIDEIIKIRADERSEVVELVSPFINCLSNHEPYTYLRVLRSVVEISVD